MEAQKDVLSAETLAAIHWLGMPEGTPFPLVEKSNPASCPETQPEPAADDPDAWRGDFDRWKAENCIHREGRDDWGGIGCLWVDFCEWAVKHDSVACVRRTFECLLADDGYRCVEGMVAGLVLCVDLYAVLSAVPETDRSGCRG